MSFWKRS